jgi:hypothetical protein
MSNRRAPKARLESAADLQRLIDHTSAATASRACKPRALLAK